MKQFYYLLMVNDGYITEEYFFNDYDKMLEFLNDFTDVEQNIENIKDEINNLKDSTKLKWLDYNI